LIIPVFIDILTVSMQQYYFMEKSYNLEFFVIKEGLNRRKKNGKRKPSEA